jgi:hypothetical protein
MAVLVGTDQVEEEAVDHMLALEAEAVTVVTAL